MEVTHERYIFVTRHVTEFTFLLMLTSWRADVPIFFVDERELIKYEHLTCHGIICVVGWAFTIHFSPADCGPSSTTQRESMRAHPVWS